jgi:hypothetical protein
MYLALAVVCAIIDACGARIGRASEARALNLGAGERPNARPLSRGAASVRDVCPQQLEPSAGTETGRFDTMPNQFRLKPANPPNGCANKFLMLAYLLFP